MGNFFGKFIIFGVFGEKSLDIMKDDYFEKNFWKKSHSNSYVVEGGQFYWHALHTLALSMLIFKKKSSRRFPRKSTKLFIVVTLLSSKSLKYFTNRVVRFSPPCVYQKFDTQI